MRPKHCTIGIRAEESRPFLAAVHQPANRKRNAVATIDTTTGALQPLPKNEGTTTPIKQRCTWTRNGTAGHRDDPELERTRARWLEPGQLRNHEPGWYIETTGADGRPVARTGPFDTLAVEYQIENTWMFGIASPHPAGVPAGGEGPTDQSNEALLSEQASEITRLGLDLRIHQAATRWTDAIEDSRRKLAAADHTEPAPTIARILHRSYREKDDVHLAYDRLVAATNAKDRWLNA